jgi:hypothetical protein
MVSAKRIRNDYERHEERRNQWNRNPAPLTLCCIVVSASALQVQGDGHDPFDQILQGSGRLDQNLHGDDTSVGKGLAE